jgi:hypothetical protein
VPKVTTSPSETERVDLKSCAGAFVILRKMTFGELNKRDMLLTTMKVMGGSRKKRASEDSIFGILEGANDKVAQFEFQCCVVDHNFFVDDEEKVPFDVRNVMHVNSLDPKVGGEIKRKIEDMNGIGDEDDDDEDGGSPNSSNGSGTESSEESEPEMTLTP